MALRTQKEAYAQNGVPSARVVAPGGEQQAGHTILDELLALDPRSRGELASECGDGRQEGLDQMPARVGISALGGHDQLALLHGGEPLRTHHIQVTHTLRRPFGTALPAFGGRSRILANLQSPSTGLFGLAEKPTGGPRRMPSEMVRAR